MTSPNDQLSRIARQGQEAVTSAVKIWADSVQRVTGSGGQGQVTDISAVVDSAFDFAERMLHTQREFTKSVLQAVQGTTARVTDAAVQGLDKTVSAGAGATQRAAGGAADLAESTTRSAADAADTTSGAAQGAAEGAQRGAEEGAQQSSQQGGSGTSPRRSSRS